MQSNKRICVELIVLQQVCASKSVTFLTIIASPASSKQ